MKITRPILFLALVALAACSPQREPVLSLAPVPFAMKTAEGILARLSTGPIDGPFAETKEAVAGYWIWEVKSMAEAVEWVKKCPNPMFEDSDIDIRPVYEASDFGEAFTPELQAKEERLRKESEALGKK